MLPGFIGIGTQRAATTWLHECLIEHPQVYLPAAKELHFFDIEFGRGMDWYEQQFEAAPDGVLAGEITPNYLECHPAMARLAATLPQARLLVILRDPIERAYSSYQLFAHRHEGIDFTAACRRDRSLLEIGKYGQHMEHVYSLYPREQVHVMLYEDVQNHPRQVLQGIFKFLQIDPDFLPVSMTQRFNRIMYPRTQAVLARIGMAGFVERIKRSPMGDWIKRRHAKAGPKLARAACGTELHELRLTIDEDIRKAESLIGRDLSHWRAA